MTMAEQRARVLVVDDEPMLCSIVARTLGPEYDVSVHVSAHEALGAIVAGARYEVVLCDLSMPGMDGPGFYRRLSAIAPELVERVIIMTGGAFTARLAEFLKETNIPRLEKPFLVPELRAVVRAHLLRLGRARDP
jgi:DNA-binding NtrC family response regulator